MANTSNHLQLIKKLGKDLNVQLKELPLDELESLEENAFSIDEEGQVTGLNLHDVKIKTILPSIKAFQSIKKLTLRSTELTDCSFLQNFRLLTYLDLTDNRIGDITALKDLEKLTNLYLTNNQVRDLSLLQYLKGVVGLGLGGNAIESISPLKSLTSLKYVDFSDNLISSVLQLQDLRAITYLNLSGNKITEVFGLEGLMQLTYLNLSRNPVTDISSLSGLAKLTYLNLHNNQLTDITALSGLLNLTELRLDGNQLTDISALSYLQNLTELHLSGNRLTDISALSGLVNLTALRFSCKQLTDISALSGLVNLTKAYLAENQLSDISPLSGLTNLTELYLHNNQLADISPLSGLTNLTKLNLNRNNLTDISTLSELINLIELGLSRNKLTDITVLSGLTNLKILGLGGNRLRDISALSRLTKLTDLRLYQNLLENIESLSGLVNLTELNLGSNQLLSVTALSNLSNLKKLNLGDNQLTDISVLSGLTQLTELRLYRNQLTDISILPNLPTLKRVTLEHNKITTVPRQWIETGLDIKWKEDYVKGVILEGNPLQFPPIEIVKRGPDAVREYYEQVKKDTIPLNETKLLIVGPGDVGKTTLLKKLKNPETQIDVGKEASTHGIDIHPWQLDCQFERQPNCTIHIHSWDFGGQEIYHATHQFFLTKRSLYLFVWDARKDDDDPQTFDYWLNVIKLLGEESPVIVIQNKSDVRVKNIDEASLKNKFPNIRAFFTVSCKTGQGIDDLSRSIRHALGQMPHLHDPMPKSWNTIRDQLRQMALSKNHITRDEFVAICAQHDIDETGAGVLGDYLHDLGSILHFQSHSELENTVILNPQWATQAVYKLVDVQDIQKNKGRFHQNDLKKYWDKDLYPRDKHTLLMSLMEKFELCFPIPGSSLHIIPELLPPAAPDIDLAAYEGGDGLHLFYFYDFMPGGIISRFIARSYFLVKDEHYWKNGVELSFEDATALVRGDRHSRKLTVTTTGGSCKDQLMGIIKNELNRIHCNLNMEPQKHYKEKIPCPCFECSRSTDPYFFDYPVLLRRWEKGKTTIDCRNSDDEIELSHLLRGFTADKSLKELDFTHELIKAGHYLQGRRKNLVTSENSWTDFIATILEARGLRIDNQSRWGISETAISIGQPDLRIINPEGNTHAIVEAFRLQGERTTTIETHLKKMFNYDPSGNEINYALIYVETQDFVSLWEWYKSYVAKMDFEHSLVALNRQEEETGYANLRAIRARHERAGKETSVFHIFIHMPPAAHRG